MIYADFESMFCQKKMENKIWMSLIQTNVKNMLQMVKN